MDAIDEGRSINDPKIQTKLNSLTRLVPDWRKRKENISLRMKTLLKIYLSKWFHRGLEWYEIEFVLNLLEYPLGLRSDFITSETLKYKGFSLILKSFDEDEKRPFNQKGWFILDFGNLESYLYSETDFHNVWNLRSVQSMRDYIFQPILHEEHEGKKGIRKARIRGYRDGKSSPRDPRLTKLARHVDQIFFSDEFEKKLDFFWSEIESLCNISC